MTDKAGLQKHSWGAIKSPKQSESSDGYPKKTGSTMPSGAAGKGGK